MGNDTSRLKGLVIDKQSVEANDFWTLYNAESPTTSNEDGRQLLSIFQGETVVNGQLWVVQGPLERAIKNLKIYRHPYILKYVSTWEQSGQKHLATERVRPLSAVLATQSSLQVCLGLRTILCSLIFLIEKAMGRHLNICIPSIYVTDDGSWRLAGFEYVWKHKELTKSLLELAKTYRYPAAIDAYANNQYENTDAIEQYAFATLCEEVLDKCSKNETAETPHANEFRDYCAMHLKHSNTQLRPRLSAVLLHPYFNHEFVLIHSFLFELPLKSIQEKQDFFTGLIDRLRYFNEEVVGSQLAADLLSRMVLLDPTAQLCVTPYVLKTKTDHSAALFSNHTYSQYVMPHIKKMFRLRDAQIRLILLEYFMEFVRLLSKEELREYILPYLHEGMNDTNDVLVAKTMHSLADLIPILGANAVIGGNRTRIFSDGRPQAAISADVSSTANATRHWVEPRSITPVMGVGGGDMDVDYMVSDSPLPLEHHVDLSGSFSSLAAQVPVVMEGKLLSEEQMVMPTRLSPDGGEDDTESAIVADGLVTEELNVAAEELLSNGIIAEKLQNFTDVCLTDKTAVVAVKPQTNGLHSENVLVDVGDANAEEEEAWSDWETDELQKSSNTNNTIEAEVKTFVNKNNTLPANSSSIAAAQSEFTPERQAELSLNKNSKTNTPNKKPTTTITNIQQVARSLKINDDLSALDIVVQKSITPKAGDANMSEFDFFKDMEPVIVPQSSSSSNNKYKDAADYLTTTQIPNNKYQQQQAYRDEEIQIDSSRFAALAINADGDADGTGWGVEDDDDDVAVGWK